MTSASTSGKSVPASEGADYGKEEVSTINDAAAVGDLSTETKSIAVIAPEGNSGLVYVGWDDDLTTSNGFELAAGTGISFDLDNSQQQIFFAGDTIGDELRYISTR